jgi:hypothetical protein
VSFSLHGSSAWYVFSPHAFPAYREHANVWHGLLVSRAGGEFEQYGLDRYRLPAYGALPHGLRASRATRSTATRPRLSGALIIPFDSSRALRTLRGAPVRNSPSSIVTTAVTVTVVRVVHATVFLSCRPVVRLLRQGASLCILSTPGRALTELP